MGLVGVMWVVSRTLVVALGRRVVSTLGLRRVAPSSVSGSTPLFNSKLNLSSVSTLRLVMVLSGRCKVGLTDPTRKGRVFADMSSVTRCVSGGEAGW